MIKIEHYVHTNNVYSVRYVLHSTVISRATHISIPDSVEQYTGHLVIPQYYFPVPSNFFDIAVPRSTDIVP